MHNTSWLSLPCYQIIECLLFVFLQKTVDLMHDNAELQLKVKTLDRQCQEYKRAQTEAQNGVWL